MFGKRSGGNGVGNPVVADSVRDVVVQQNAEIPQMAESVDALVNPVVEKAVASAPAMTTPQLHRHLQNLLRQRPMVKRVKNITIQKPVFFQR